ncbi:type I-MYXAN CRISPR-associated protein Cas6/Cmx6 [Dulcicalothrix desertica PCC 7102]|uniref:Type I-MYXAN CRISPR-associated protein Cas6/Cmx6 n=1 Tax=Dulcicalothrix desertica PCC 7102 TaxID=232991 RepID=A0A433VVS1_9CYAN|nr:type I-MYXAN CRISPR-associated protein Cas6/Cmx6 [Dulcicalothrix desertica]RUT10191.1 type I-MYXAN CRISPR-associated protein Cas6/Cmx6 [Dulcicalothrix desertica PCC 7102]TWH40827.1 CRISPR-associated endonuclease/helicase Cas3 [Dulcicalothrix desertica PCC 7102]
MKPSVDVSASESAEDDLAPFVELGYQVHGKYLPADHNYGLYAAFVHLVPELRQHDDVSILTIPGIGDKQGKILITEQSYLKIRVPVTKIPLVYQLAGKRFSVGVHEIQIGIPTVSVLKPASKLRARIVTIKGKDYTEKDAFLEAARRQLQNLNISGDISVPLDRQGLPSRKTIKVKRFTIVGFTTEITQLSDEDSVKLQQWGLGGKRHMGCGIFMPYRNL